MTNHRHISIFVFLSLFTLVINAQELEQSYLNTLGDEPLLTLFDTHTGDSINQEKIARTYLDRARRQKDTIKMARGYDRLARIFHPEKNIAFADSVIYLTKDMNHMTYPAMGYMIKGFEQSDNDLHNSTKNYYKAFDIANSTDNVAQQLYLLDALIVRKSFWGDKNEALELQRKSLKIIQQDNFKELMIKTSRKGYINRIDEFILEMKFNSYISYSTCFINAREIDSAYFYYNKAKEINNSYNGYLNDDHKITLLELIKEIQFYSNAYEETIKYSDSILNLTENTSYYSSILDAYYFKGVAQLKQQKEKQGIYNLLKADSIIESGNVKLLPYRRNVFTILLEYYKEHGDLENQIKYYKKVTVCDSLFKKNYAFYESSFKNEIQTPMLVAEKDNLIQKLKRDNELPDPKIYIILSALITSLCFLFYYVRKRRGYKKRFEALVANNNKQKLLSFHDNEYKNELSAEVVEDILLKLERFERQHRFLRPDLTLQLLAKEFKTNSNYLSRVVNLKLEKNFSQYIHDLRITYAVEELLTNPAYRKYTIKAIAEECGYSNSESFSRAFYKINGIYPSYYIKKLEKNTG